MKYNYDLNIEKLINLLGNIFNNIREEIKYIILEQIFVYKYSQQKK